MYEILDAQVKVRDTKGHVRFLDKTQVKIEIIGENKPVTEKKPEPKKEPEKESTTKKIVEKITKKSNQKSTKK